jgi:hypothetical protein
LRAGKRGGRLEWGGDVFVFLFFEYVCDEGFADTVFT